MTERASRSRPALFTNGQALAALGYRNYRLYFVGQFISMIGTWVQGVAQGWLVWRLTQSEFAVGMVTAFGSAPMLLLSLVGGTVADRVDRRRLLLVTQSLAMFLAALLGYLSLLPGLQVWHVAAVAACLGAVSAFDVPTRQAFVVQMVDRGALMNAIALNSMLFNGARVVGPAVASVLIAIPWIGVPGCFFVNSASYMAALTALVKIRVASGEPFSSESSPVALVLGGVRYVIAMPLLRRLITLLFVVGVFGWSGSVLMPAMAEKVLHGGAGTYGGLMTAAGVGAVAGALILASLGDTPHRRRLVFGGLALVCAALLGFSLSSWIPLSMVAIGLFGMGMILFFATSNTVVQTIVPDELRGRVMGVWALVFAGSTPIGSLMAGAIARQWGAPAAIQVGVLAMAVCGALIYRQSRRERAQQVTGG
ncbi:MAG: MFS transporter [Armatimonadetes bacterium]|nr:MFS transporter [Armatimonadota bacterium]